MLHVATAHRGTRWVEIQARELRRHLHVPYTLWGSLAGAEDRHGVFDRLVAQKGPEHAKLNHLAAEIEREAQGDDLIMFLDPYAFPVADPMPVIERALAQAPLLAVRRDENFEPQPSPCFCVTTVAAWRRLAGDWSDGYIFTTCDGRRGTGPGANLLRRLELSGTPWVPLQRSNGPRGDALMFAVYGGVIYRHGGGEIPAVQRRAPRPLPQLWWERHLLRRSARRGDELYAAIAAGGDGWLEGVR